MNKPLLPLFAALACAAPAPSLQAGGPVTNPLIWADVPDTSVIRVGDTYYMSSTTMHMSPGLPIMKSADLVNWEIASYAHGNFGDTDELNLANGKNAYGQGSWASSLQHHEGVFHVSTFSYSTGKTHVYSTTDPDKGPWRETSFAPAMHDGSLVFDEGRVFLAHGGHNIRLTELNADLTGVKPGGFDDYIIREASFVAGPRLGLRAEGAQIFKVDGKYYAFLITWPPDDMRTALVFRADKLTGPYEGRVALRDNGVAQGGIVQTPAGDWHGIFFRDSGPVGRIPYIVPVKWEDGWPVLGVDGKVPATVDLPARRSGPPAIVGSDEFDRRPGDPALPLVWQWNHNPDPANWSFTARPGYLRLTTGRVDAGFTQARNTLTQRTFGPESSARVGIDVSAMKDGDVAGLAALQKKYGYVGVTQHDGARFLVMVGVEKDVPVERVRVPLGADTVHLRIDCDFRRWPEKARFHYSLDGESWTAIGEPLEMVYTLPHFMGYRFGLFNFATRAPGGHVDFNYYRVTDRIPAND